MKTSRNSFLEITISAIRVLVIDDSWRRQNPSTSSKYWNGSRAASAHHVEKSTCIIPVPCMKPPISSKCWRLTIAVTAGMKFVCLTNAAKALPTGEFVIIFSGACCRGATIGMPFMSTIMHLPNVSAALGTAEVTCRSSFPAGQKSSPSRMAIQSPLVSSSPLLYREARCAGPLLSLVKTRILESRFA